MRKILALLAALVVATPAAAVPLQSWSDWVTAYPSAARAVTPAALMVRGMNENVYYVLEVDPTTGEIPVTANVTINAEGTPGSPVPAVALYVAGTDGTNLRGLKTDASGELQVDVLSSALPTGAATAANQTSEIGLLTTIDADTGNIATSTASIDAKLDEGQETMANSLAVVIASDQSAIPINDNGGTITVDGTVAATQSGTWTVQPGNTANTTPWLTTISQGGNAATVTGSNALKVDGSAVTQPVSGTVAASNFPATVDTNSGAAGASTLRSVLATRHEAAATPLSVRLSDGSSFGTPSPAGRSYADSARNSYSSVNVTTGAWVQLIASTAATINGITLFDSCGQTLELGTGAAASETRRLIIPPGGIDGFIPLAIASGTRVSIRAISGNCTSGEINITGLN